MEINQVDNKLKQIISEISKIKTSINENTSMVEDLGFDSFEIMHLIVLIEENFSFEFLEEDLDLSNIDVYSDLLEHVINSINRVEGVSI